MIGTIKMPDIIVILVIATSLILLVMSLVNKCKEACIFAGSISLILIGWFCFYLGAQQKTLNPVTKEVHIIDGIAVARYEDKVINLNHHLNQNFKDGDKVTIARKVAFYYGIMSTNAADSPLEIKN